MNNKKKKKTWILRENAVIDSYLLNLIEFTGLNK